MLIYKAYYQYHHQEKKKTNAIKNIDTMLNNNERITQFLIDLYNDKLFLATEEDSFGVEDIGNEAIDAGLVKMIGDRYYLTDKGRFLIKDNKTYDDFEKERRAPISSSVHIGHNISGSNNVVDSHLNRSINSPNQKPEAKAQTTAKRVKIESWVKFYQVLLQ